MKYNILIKIIHCRKQATNTKPPKTEQKLKQLKLCKNAKCLYVF